MQIYGRFRPCYRLFYFFPENIVKRGRQIKGVLAFSVLTVLCKNSVICDWLIPGFALWLAKKFTNDPMAALVSSYNLVYIGDTWRSI